MFESWIWNPSLRAVVVLILVSLFRCEFMQHLSADPYHSRKKGSATRNGLLKFPTQELSCSPSLSRNSERNHLVPFLLNNLEERRLKKNRKNFCVDFSREIIGLVSLHRGQRLGGRRELVQVTCFIKVVVSRFLLLSFLPCVSSFCSFCSFRYALPTSPIYHRNIRQGYGKLSLGSYDVLKKAYYIFIWNHRLWYKQKTKLGLFL